MTQENIGLTLNERIAAHKAAREAAQAAAKAIAKTPKEVKVKAVKVKNQCECGCGLLTNARFCVGHDAKLKSRLFKLADSEDSLVSEPAIAELESRNWLHLKATPKEPTVKKESNNQAAIELARQLTELVEEGDYRA